jgi:hypothetical protein
MNHSIRSVASTERDRHHQQGSAAAAGRFVRHLLEMVLAMAAGMAVFSVTFRWLLTPTGYRALHTHSPLLWFAGMGISMMVPMIAWMRYHQGHSGRQCAEMTAAMLVPSGTIAALVQFGVIADPWLAARPLSTSTHVAMLLGMILVMLYRFDQYAGAWSGGTPMDGKGTSQPER